MAGSPSAFPFVAEIQLCTKTAVCRCSGKLSGGVISRGSVSALRRGVDPRSKYSLSLGKLQT